MEWKLEQLGDHYKAISRMFREDLFQEVREYCLKNLSGNEYEIISSLVEWVWSHQCELDEYIKKEQEESVYQAECSHWYGHSSLWDRLIEGEDDEQKCLIDKDQQFNSTYPYEMFNYCPDCGKKFKRGDS